jgi:4,5-DOPA dioxygenase extradiol
MSIAPEELVESLAELAASEAKMPALFVGHGNPMNAIEDNEFTRSWAEVAESLPRPRAILCLSAHWETDGTRVTAMDWPRTIHDFGGFPRQLFEVQYPAPGSPELARLVQQTATEVPVGLDFEWGLDHGAWSVLRRMFPNADVPVIQLSLDRTREPAFHYELGRQLRSLRRNGVLIIGSGNMVHNLRMIAWQDVAYDWAREFDEKLQQLILARDHDSIINYQHLSEEARLAVPTNEHFLPLLYVLGLQDDHDEVGFFADKVTLGSISMRSVRIG